MNYFENRIEDIVKDISEKTEINFSFNSNLIQSNQKFTLRLNDTSLRTVLDKLLIGTGVKYKVVSSHIVLFKEQQGLQLPLYNLSGQVMDKYTGDPIRGAHVFVAGTMKGGTTDVDGNYNIEHEGFGSIQLAVSHLSYEVNILQIKLNGVQNHELNFQLDPKINQLKELKIVSLKYKEWQNYLELFKKEFLGATPNASKCEIMNPEVLDFNVEDDRFSTQVRAYKPLIILNTALGYELNYYLDYFEMSKGNTKNTGISNFRELEAKNKREKKRWVNNRNKSYYGSLTHFLRSLYQNKLKQEGFKLYLVDQLPIDGNFKERIIKPDKLNTIYKSNGSNTLSFEGYLKVVYTKETESPAYINDQIKMAVNDDQFVKNYYGSLGLRLVPGRQTSFIKLNQAKVTVNPSGYFNERLAVTTLGYWSWERVAEYLPIEYDP